MSSTATKWKELKENYSYGFKCNYKKLRGEHIKLTYQYNDLFKLSQEYRTRTTHLQEQIALAKHHHHLQQRDSM